MCPAFSDGCGHHEGPVQHPQVIVDYATSQVALAAHHASHATASCADAHSQIVAENRGDRCTLMYSRNTTVTK